MEYVDVGENAIISGSVELKGNIKVFGRAILSGNIILKGNMKITNS